jgi:hypothetical protein
MPHVIVKLWPGKSEQQKPRFVAREEVKSQGWIEKVYKPDIMNKWGTNSTRNPDPTKMTCEFLPGNKIE